MGQLNASTVSWDVPPRTQDRQSQHDISDKYWWSKEIGSHLMLLLTKAGYALDAQVEALTFLYHILEWGDGNKPPEVRYSIEAIPPVANTASDPLNQAATYALLSQLQAMSPNIDLSLFHHFAASFFGPRSPGKFTSTTVTRQQSSLFLAFEMSRHIGEISTKCYFVPVPTVSNTVAEQISSAIKSSSYHSHLPAITELEQFLLHDRDGQTIIPIMLGIDCVDPSKSRLKIYARSTKTSFEFVRRVMSLGGRRQGIEEEEKQLKDLWCRVLGLPEVMNMEEELHFCDHPTAGTLFYFDVGPKEVAPDVKVYIPVRHYSESDRKITDGLASFMKKYGRGSFVDGYKEVVEGLATKKGIDEGTGVHTYVTAAYQNGGLAVTSYFNPQLHHRARWA
ncbi:tryptophan dimethylallyltransferase-domain-containing protein [Cercophora samala]|uniref:Tryptophan dimethylallyltransferase-domain-containing protein n=1 Tax=Cercophora samala TaxID=330535 RepID=A0AA40DD46_9PEZI|nr:tryptophan dimethylallyltransferase-domain-containing protein [Cercophora samala]